MTVRFDFVAVVVIVVFIRDLLAYCRLQIRAFELTESVQPVNSIVALATIGYAKQLPRPPHTTT